MRRHDGFTVLELLVTIGVIALVVAVVAPNYSDWSAKRSFMTTYNELRNELSDMRSTSMSRNTTSRLNLQFSNGVYIITSYISPSPVSGCNPLGTWTQLYTRQLNVHSFYQIIGSGVGGDICFYRDGGSSGAQYNITPISVAGLPSANITVTIATGYLDVTTTN
jgi:prepilin-type N-terminal cleavage/methylation domain-containing protein